MPTNAAVLTAPTAPSAPRATKAREIASEGRLNFRFTPADRANVSRLQARARTAHGVTLSTSQAIRAGLALAALEPDRAVQVMPRVQGGRPRSPLSEALAKVRSEYSANGQACSK